MIELNNTWDEVQYNKLINYLNNIGEEKYKDFNSKLVLTKYKMHGIKVPILRDIAKKISKTNIISFLDIVKSNSYEEVMIEGLVISYIKEVDLCVKYFNKFINKIDNWAICDTCISSMKIVNKNKELFLKQIKKYIKSKNEYVVRVGVVLLLNYYIEDSYIDLVFDIINSINREDYYINMAIAWLVSVCFVKYRNKTFKYLNDNKLNRFTYNKSIQKIIESYRVSLEDKEILRSMKRGS